MAQQAFDLDVDVAMKALAVLAKVGGRTINRLAEAVGMAAFKAERQAKIAATDLIYSQPERGYSRTGTLRRGIMAASPDYDHSGDEGAARSADLGGGLGMEVTKITATAIESAVGSWISYARFVNDGTRYMEPRPFLDEGLKTAEEDLEQFTLVALNDILQDFLPA